MGRAIDMEKDIDALKLKIEKLENTVRGMVSKLDKLDEKSSKTTHVDLTGVHKDEEEKANDEGDGKSNKQSNNKHRKSKKKNV